MCIAHQHLGIFVASDEGYAKCPQEILETKKIASAVGVRYRQWSITRKGVGGVAWGNNLLRARLTDD